MPSRAGDVIHRCELLAAFSEEAGHTTRRFLSPPMRDVHGRLTAWMTDAGMSVRVDAAGNLRGVYPASSPGAGRVVIGSHLDTVPCAGAFDGVLGVVLGLALVEGLNGRRVPFAIEVIGFSDEEGVRFGVPFLGSRALAGTVDEALLARRDTDGRTVCDAIRDYGLDPGRMDEASADPSAIAYVEFHIEQGPVLERLGAPIGIVEAIVGQTRAEVTFTGTAGHAGTTPMSERRDALAGAAEWIGIVERDAQAVPGLVATVGRIDVEPGAGNVIPGRCTATLDIRHAEDDVRGAATARVEAHARDIAARRSLRFDWSPRLDQPSVAFDRTLVATLERAVRRAGVPVHLLPSGAGHDAMIVAARMPSAMLFLRSPGGLSHHPDESVLEEDVSVALEVGRHLLNELAVRCGTTTDHLR
jgi:allantoate deiminase